MPVATVLSNDSAEFPEGAFCDPHYVIRREGGTAYVPVIHLTHVGMCLFETEKNGYDDSDFYMEVWNPDAGCAESVMFGTTRFPSYAQCNYSRHDATPEVRAAYGEWYTRRQAERAAQRARHRAEMDAKAVRDLGLAGTEQLERLRAAFTDEAFDRVGKLLKTRKFRSDFRARLAQQVRDWLADPAPRHPTPLSPRQLAYV